MPSPRRRAARALALPLLLIGLAAAPAAAQDASDFDRIAAETAELRGLPIESDIVEAFLTRPQLGQRLLEILAKDYPPAEIAADERALKAFGLIEADLDLGAFVLDLYTEQIAGFYDSATDEMYVIGADDELDAAEELTYSHEVIHALQDQAFDLEAVQSAVEDGTDDDRAVAISALIEGDAVSSSVDYLIGHPVLAGRLALVGTPNTTVFDSAPPLISQGLLFPYLAGQGFVAALRAEGGWDAVNAAYADPPASTEQVLHPEKYLDRDDPTAVALPADLGDALGPGWTKAEENNFGEFQTSVLLAELAPGEGFNATGGSSLPEGAVAAAAGWDGDRYAVWADGDRDAIVWHSVWDTEEDAAEFAGALQTREEGRFDVAFEGDAADATLLAADDIAVRVVTVGAEVFYVLAPDADLAETALTALQAA